MGKWRDYRVGKFRLRQLNGEGCAVWYDERGKRYRYRLGCLSEIESRAALHKFAKQETYLTATRGSTIADLFVSYIRDRELDGKQTDPMWVNWKALNETFGKLTIHDITDDLCRDYAQMRFDLGRSPSTVHTELNRLRTSLNWAAKRRITDFSPHVWLPSPSPPRDRVLSEKEIIKLLDGCASHHARLFVILALATAGRTTALCELTWDRVDFENGEIDLNKPENIGPMKKSFK